jgi:heme/copper-type cytochrome/quinol oxidase subunit 4
MGARTVVLALALVFIGLLSFLTLTAAINEGINVLTGISVLILAMFAFGIVGALREPPPRD